MKYFVWIKNLHGSPEVQVWWIKQTDGNGKAKDVLKLVELDKSDTRDLNKLKQDYPYEV